MRAAIRVEFERRWTRDAETVALTCSTGSKRQREGAHSTGYYPAYFVCRPFLLLQPQQNTVIIDSSDGLTAACFKQSRNQPSTDPQNSFHTYIGAMPPLHLAYTTLSNSCTAICVAGPHSRANTVAAAAACSKGADGLTKVKTTVYCSLQAPADSHQQPAYGPSQTWWLTDSWHTMNRQNKHIQQ